MRFLESFTKEMHPSRLFRQASHWEGTVRMLLANPGGKTHTFGL